ncbi:Trichohyalin [Giardia lamblia P15]|uniref:Trichohyalin n=1 Tax=Giardia intestinalis (strain P15) TaxID=658858 RepID=E1F4A9_GIAIA|nr:Trichohyalin [Giardia lamblia P15]
MSSFKQINPADKITDPPTSPRSIVAMNRCGITPPDILYVSREELKHRIAYKNLTDKEFAIYYDNYEAMRKEALSQAIAEYQLILEQGISKAEAALYPHLRFPNVTSAPSTPRGGLSQTSTHNPDELKAKIIERHIKEVEINLRQRIAKEAQQQLQLEAAQEHRLKAQEIENRMTAKYEDEAIKYILQEQHRLEIFSSFQRQQEECRKRSYAKTIQEMHAHDALLQRRQRYLDDQSVRSKTRSVPREEFLYQLAQERKAEDRARELEFKERQLIREQRSQRAQEKKRQEVEKLQQSLRENQLRHTKVFNEYWEDVARSKSVDHALRENRRLAGAKRASTEKLKENAERISETSQRIEVTLKNFGKIYRNRQDAKARKLEEEELRSSRHILETSVNARQRALEDELLKDLRTKRAEMHLRRVQYEKENVLSNKEFKAINSIRALNMTKEKEEELMALSNKLHTQRHILKGSQTIRDDGYLDIPDDLRKLAPPESILRCHYMDEAIDMLKGEESFKRTLRMVPVSESYASVYKSIDTEPRKKKPTRSQHVARHNSISDFSMDTPDSGRPYYQVKASRPLRSSSNGDGLLVERRSKSLTRPRTASRSGNATLDSSRTDSTPGSSYLGSHHGGAQVSSVPLRPGNASRPKKVAKRGSSKPKASHNSMHSVSDSTIETPQWSDSVSSNVSSTKKKPIRLRNDDANLSASLPLPTLKGPGSGLIEEEKKRNATVRQSKKEKPKDSQRNKSKTDTEIAQDSLLRNQSMEIVRQLSQLAKLNKPAISNFPPPDERRELLGKLTGATQETDYNTENRTQQIYASLSIRANEAGMDSKQFEQDVLPEHTQTRHLFASLGKSNTPNDHMDGDLILTTFSKATPEATQINDDTPKYFAPGSMILMQESAPPSRNLGDGSTKDYVATLEYPNIKGDDGLRPAELSTYSIVLPPVSAGTGIPRVAQEPQSPQRVVNFGIDVTASDLKISSLEKIPDISEPALINDSLPAEEAIATTNTRESIGYFVSSSANAHGDNTDDET